MKHILAVIAIVTGILSIAIANDAKANELVVSLCDDQIVEWYFQDDTGAKVIATHSALQNSYPLKQYLLEFKATNPDIFTIEVCAEPEEEATENGWMRYE